MEGPEETIGTLGPIRRYRGLSGLSAGILIALGIAVTFWWVVSDWSDSKFLLCSDAWQYDGPTLHFMDDRLHHGEFPLWNPLYFCGQPYAANPQSFVFYPPNLLRSLLTFQPTPFKTHVGVVVMVFLELWVGGIGAFLLARRHKISWSGSMVAALAFTLSAPSVTRACGHWVFHNVVCWLPLLLLSIRLGMSEPEWRKKLRYGAAGGVLLALALLGGTLQLSVLVVLSAGLYWGLSRAFEPGLGAPAEPATTPAAAIEEKKKPKKQKKATEKTGHAALWRSWLFSRAKRWGTDAVLLAFVFCVAGLLAAPLLLPAREFSSFTERGNKGIQAEEEVAPMKAGWGLAKALTIYQGAGEYEGIRASGAAVLILALAGLLCRPRRNLILFALLFLFLLDTTLSEPLLFGRMLRWAMPFTSNYARGMIVACLPLGLLAGAGLDSVLVRAASPRLKIARSLAILAVGGAILSVLVFVERPLPLLPVGWPALAVPLGLCAALLAGIWLRTPAKVTVLIALLVFLESWAWNRHLVPSCIPEHQRCTLAMPTLREPRGFWTTNRRETDLNPNLKLYDLQAIMNGYDPLHLRATRELICGKPAAKLKYFPRVLWAGEATAQSYIGNLLLKRQFWLARQYVEGPMPGKDELFPSTTTVFLERQGEVPVPRVERESLLSRGLSPDLERLVLKPAQSPPMSVNSNDLKPGMALRCKAFTLPAKHSSLFVRFSSSCELELQPAIIESKTQHYEYGKKIVLDGKDGKGQFYEIPMPDFAEVSVEFHPDFQGRTGLLSLLEAYVDSDKADQGGLITILSRTANSVEVQTGPLPGPRVLVYVDAFYPGWRAYVDGKPAPILRADDVFKAVALPAGVHRVEFIYRDWRVYAGMGISAFMLMGMAVLGWVTRIPKPRTSTANGHE